MVLKYLNGSFNTDIMLKDVRGFNKRIFLLFIDEKVSVIKCSQKKTFLRIDRELCI